MQIGLKYTGEGRAEFWLSSSGSSSASLTNIQSCGYKALHSTVLGRVPERESSSPPLVYGTHFHTAQFIRAYDKLGHSDKTLAKLGLEGKVPFSSDREKLTRDVLIHNHDLDPLPIQGNRTFSSLLTGVDSYEEFTQTADKDLRYCYIKLDGVLQPAYESKFTVILAAPGEHSIEFPEPLSMPFFTDGHVEEHEVSVIDICYQGTLDSIRTLYGSPYIQDYKTSTDDDPNFFQMYGFSNQFMGYMYIARQGLELYDQDGVTPISEPFRGVICDKINLGRAVQSPDYTLLKSKSKSLGLLQEKIRNGQFEAMGPGPKKKFYDKFKLLEEEVTRLDAACKSSSLYVTEFTFERQALTDYYTEGHLKFWRSSVIMSIKNFLQNHAEGTYVQNRTACKGKWGMCPYFQVCLSEPSEHFQTILGRAFKNKVWK